MCVSGAKLPDPCSYGHTQFHVVQDRYHRDQLGKKGQEDQVEGLLRAQGLASLFCWTGAQAAYQGRGGVCVCNNNNKVG